LIHLTCANQHGFKFNKSTSTLSAELQLIIGRALDENEYAQLASLDLSSAFDLLNTDLLLKRMRIIGLPSDVINLIKVWVTQQLLYLSIRGENSLLYNLLLGTVQGSTCPSLIMCAIKTVFG
jgi:hypothetical protein